jgi:hypothetical protein
LCSASCNDLRPDIRRSDKPSRRRGWLTRPSPPAWPSSKTHESHSGQQIQIFRAFDPTRDAVLTIPVRGFSDLDPHQDLVLSAGHVERKGLVVVNSRPEQDHAAPPREAGRPRRHADDEHFVLWDAETARASEHLCLRQRPYSIAVDRLSARPWRAAIHGNQMRHRRPLMTTVRPLEQLPRVEPLLPVPVRSKACPKRSRACA